jgi:RNA polymerase sigma-70 factor (ECF subfamily)
LYLPDSILLTYREAILDAQPDAITNVTETIRLAQQGDRSAFQLLFREHVGRVYALCVRTCGNASRAEELTQDVFVRTWEMIGSFRGESAFSSWLHRLTVNVVLASIRSDKRRTARIFGTDDLEPFETSADTTLSGRGLDLEDAIRRLPTQARVIFVFHDIEGYKHEEIADKLGIAVGTSKAQLHRARKLLREVLER